MILGSNGQPLPPSRPEPRVTVKFRTQDAGDTKRELELLALATGIRLTIETVTRNGSYHAGPDKIEVEVYGREPDVQRYMDAVKKWSAAGE